MYAFHLERRFGLFSIRAHDFIEAIVSGFWGYSFADPEVNCMQIPLNDVYVSAVLDQRAGLLSRGLSWSSVSAVAKHDCRGMCCSRMCTACSNPCYYQTVHLI